MIKAIILLILLVLLVGCTEKVYIYDIFEGNCTCDYRIINTSYDNFYWRCYNNTMKFEGDFYQDIVKLKETCIGKTRIIDITLKSNSS